MPGTNSYASLHTSSYHPLRCVSTWCVTYMWAKSPTLHECHIPVIVIYKNYLLTESRRRKAGCSFKLGFHSLHFRLHDSQMEGVNVYLKLCLICLSLFSAHGLLCNTALVQPPSLLISPALSSPQYSSFPWFPQYFPVIDSLPCSLLYSWRWSRAFGLEKCRDCKSLLWVQHSGSGLLGLAPKDFL